jgi:hypothetical protein
MKIKPPANENERLALKQRLEREHGATRKVGFESGTAAQNGWRCLGIGQATACQTEGRRSRFLR